MLRIRLFFTDGQAFLSQNGRSGTELIEELIKIEKQNMNQVMIS